MSYFFSSFKIIFVFFFFKTGINLFLLSFFKWGGNIYASATFRPLFLNKRTELFAPYHSGKWEVFFIKVSKSDFSYPA